jgi:predicted porin
MKKTLIAAGIAAVVAAPAAFADVSVSGGVEQAFTKTDNGVWAGSSDNFVTFKASEDLGNGLTAFAAITLDVDNTSEDDGTQSTKDEVVGIKGSFGTVMTGRFEDFTEGKLMSRLTLEGDGSAAGGALEGGANAGRTSHGVAYVSPTVNGFHVGVGGYAVANSASWGSVGLDAVDVALFYDNGPLSVAISHEMYNSSAAVDQDSTTMTASYKMGDAKVTVLRQDVNNVGNATGDETDTGLRLDYAMGNNTITVSYLEDEDYAAGTVTTLDKWGVEVAHNFSKRTKVYANMIDMDATNADTMTIGLKHKF